MRFSARWGAFGRAFGQIAAPPALRFALAMAGGVLAAACQKEDNHAPFVSGCTSDCKPTPGISIGGGAGGSAPVVTGTDASFDAGTLTGIVAALADDSFTRATPFTKSATVSADGAAGAVVSAAWNGMDRYSLSGVAVAQTNWVAVTPDQVQGDALPTFQAVQTNATGVADLVVVDAAAIDSVLTAVSATRAAGLGQVVLFFRNKGTGAALSGVRATMNNAAEVPAYAAASGWVFADDTTTTGASGLVVFGNVALPVAGSTTQSVTVTRPATATAPAISGGQFALKVVEGAVTLASIDLQL